MTRRVVVGASLAGMLSVQALRRYGSAEEVVLVGAEPGTEEGDEAGAH
jgi:NADPH-dependent 2,4-dienoyl-CoA reductase/sulfur reductase-like enzyme